MRWAGLICTLLLAGCNNDRVAKLENQTAELQQQVASLQKSGQLDLQAKCAKDAKAWFDDHWGRPDKDTILLDYTNHYNVKKNQCFVTVEYHFNTGGFGWTNSISLYDVYENQKYGEVMENHNLVDGKETLRQDMCQVGGTKCTSLSQYNSLSAEFMSN
jgi:outer membrane murein-binding lipoprotein Lpp